MKTYQQYMCALLQNTEWMKSTIARYGRNDGTIGAVELVTAIADCDSALRDKFDLEKTFIASVEIDGDLRFNGHGVFDHLGKEFEVEGFLKDSEPPKEAT